VRLQSGAEWGTQTLPMLEEVLKSLAGDGDGASLPQVYSAHQNLDKLPPVAAYLTVHNLIIRREGDPPLPRGPHESAQQAALRAKTQPDALATILPSSEAESDEDFLLRLEVFTPKTSRGKTRMPVATLVPPRQRDEGKYDFAARMKEQLVCTFTVLPRSPFEKKEQFTRRLEAIDASRTLWADAKKGAPLPLLLPRGEHECESVCAERLERASTPPGRGGRVYCPVWLPQAIGESDGLAMLRVRAQTYSKETLVPFDPKLETESSFEERVGKQRVDKYEGGGADD